jgi:hypothetical protein
MTTSGAPELATYLLLQFTGPDHQAMVGDLIEQYAGGRSRSWYWRQVIPAIARSTITDARAHAGSTLGGIAIGWIMLSAFVSVLSIVRVQLTVGSLINVKLWWWQHGGPPLAWPLGIAWLTIGALSTGWLVVRTQRGRWNGSVLVYLASYFAVELTLIGVMIVSVSRDPHVYHFAERWRLAAEGVMVFIIWPVCILLGALVHQRAGSAAASSNPGRKTP